MKRETLDEVGGFAAFADQLADDYEIGRAVRAKGYTLAIPALGVAHTAAEDSLTSLMQHELRWNRTIRMLNPLGHLGTIITFGFPLSLLAALLVDFRPPSLAIVGRRRAWSFATKCSIEAAVCTNSSTGQPTYSNDSR